MSNNLTAQREEFAAILDLPLSNEFLREQNGFLFGKDANGCEWSVKLTKTGKIKANSLRREF